MILGDDLIKLREQETAALLKVEQYEGMLADEWKAFQAHVDSRQSMIYEERFRLWKIREAIKALEGKP